MSFTRIRILNELKLQKDMYLDKKLYPFCIVKLKLNRFLLLWAWLHNVVAKPAYEWVRYFFQFTQWSKNHLYTG